MSMDDMLSSLMGGGQGEEEAGGSDMLSGLLGMLGGGGASQGGGLTDLLGALMGDGQGMDPGAGSEVSGISQQTGIPPELVMAGLSFLMGKLMGGSQQSSGSGVSSGGMGLEDLLQGQQGDVSGAGGAGMNLSELMQSMQSEQAGQYVESTGANEEFAQQTGLDPDQASQALQGILGALRGRTGGVSG
jgi:hypothetical protein